MPIREESFRIGCGRYIQKPWLLNECANEIVRFGKSPLIVGGKTALQLTRDAIEKSVSSVCEKYKFITHTLPCCDECAKDIAELAKNEGYDVIVGVGGGIIMDFSKLIGFYADSPVINIPTSTATCAAYTPLSVCYTREGRTVGTKHYEYEVDAVLADSELLCKQPARLFLAGVFDSLAKYIEIKHRFSEDSDDYPLGLDWAYTLAKSSYDKLIRMTSDCLDDMARGEVTETVERVIFTALATTGVISGIARGSNQTAIAHKFYECTRKLYPEASRPYLHGEIVGVGLLLQNHFSGEIGKNEFFVNMMKKYGMPSSIGELDIQNSESTKEQYFDFLSNSSSIDKTNQAELKKLRESLDYLFLVKGEN